MDNYIWYINATTSSLFNIIIAFELISFSKPGWLHHNCP